MRNLQIKHKQQNMKRQSYMYKNWTLNGYYLFCILTVTLFLFRTEYF